MIQLSFLTDGTFLAAAALIAAAGYLLGSIPFGVLITRAAGLGDVRAIGSGNIGATNVLRTGRKDLALLTLLLDGGKGAAAVVAARYAAFRLLWPGMVADQSTTLSEMSLLNGQVVLLAAVAGGAAFLGHLFPAWLRFKGGKGVATFFGVLIATAWPVGLAAGAVWLLVAAVFRFSSLAALAAAVAAPNIAVVTGQPSPVIVLAAVMGVLILLKHRANIARLRTGAEPRIGGAKAAAEDPA